MSICIECGAHSPDQVTRGPLSVQLDPPRGYWKGVAFHLSPREAATLHLLCARGEAAHLAIEMVAVGEDATSYSAKMVIAHIRKRLRHTTVRIKGIYDWGYKLEIEDDD